MPSKTDEHKEDGEGSGAGRSLAKVLGIAGGILAIAGTLIAALLWLFSVNATANYAKDEADAQKRAIEDKADKSEVRDGFHEIDRKLDQINDFLLNNGGVHSRKR